MLDSKLKMSTAHNPQTDGHAEVMNGIIETYLRIYSNYCQKEWDLHLKSAEPVYSSSIFEVTGLTPLHMDLGRNTKI